MLKGFVTGLCIAAGFIVGVGGFTLYGMHEMAKGMERVVAEMDKPMVAPATDNLERFRACVLNNFDGDANFAVNECADALRDWQDSPTFKAEWDKLMAMDINVRFIIQHYKK